MFVIAIGRRRTHAKRGSQEIRGRDIIRVQEVDGCTWGTAAGGVTGTVPDGVTGLVDVGAMDEPMPRCLPISIPIKKSKIQSSTRQVTVMATIREVIVKTY